MNRIGLLVLSTLAASVVVLPNCVVANDRPPNVVMIMTDNHGAWTLGCYGNSEIRTPHIDRLAREGTLFEQAFASNPVCSPTRATVLTGLLPSQHGVHCFLRGNRLQVGPEARNTLADFRSLPEILKDRGYRCGLVGKWHLGDNLTPQEGLTDYWITMPHGGTSTFYGAQVIENGEIRTEPEYLTDFWTRHAVRFVQQQTDQQPFFLFLSYNGPYALSRLLLREGQNRHAEYYRSMQLNSFPREKTHPWQLHNRDYINNPISIRRVATEVSGVDDGVGRVLQALDDAGLEENTLVIFLADQGWVGGHGGFFGMGDHTAPVTARDGMMQIPMIWRQPKAIAAGRRVNRLVANYDVLPTLLDQLKIDEQPPRLPGRSFADDLDPKSTPPSPLVRSTEAWSAVYYEFETLRCIRTPEWKYVHRHPGGPHELYHLRDDPDEFNNLVQQRPDVARSLKKRLFEYYDSVADPKYDLWNGGSAQTVRYTKEVATPRPPETVEPPPWPDGFEPHELTLPDGFESELAAGPPLVTHPTMGCFDDRGRLYVCNNAGVNLSAEQLEEQLPNGIVRLEDVDGDGRFDRSTAFADQMTFPMGAAWHDGALYVASPPYIWRLRDDDDDGVADQREAIVKKFGYTGNAASIHGCFFSPNGRLFWCDGYHGHEFHDADGNVVSLRKGSYLFSCRPDGSDVRIHCGGGMDNPVEVDFTPEGEVIGTVNILYSRPRVDALVHWQPGGAYPHRQAVLDELQITGALLEPIHRFGHVAVSGTTRYRSGTMNHAWRDDFFVTFFNHGKVVRTELRPSDSSYGVVQREFLSCASRDFHPTDVIEDADGSLLVVDTGGWFYRGCPTSQMARPDVLGGIYRIRRTGMTTVPDPRGHAIDWSRRTRSELLRDLKDTRFAVRERATHEVAVRPETVSARQLAHTIRNADLPARQQALWAVARRLAGSHYRSTKSPSETRAIDAATKQTEDLRAAVVAALADPNTRVRRVACNILFYFPDATSLQPLQKLLRAEDPALQRAAAEALGELDDASAIPKLVPLVGSNDRELAHAATWAVLQLGGVSRQLLGSVPRNDSATRIRLSLINLQVAPEQVILPADALCEWPVDSGLQSEYLTYLRYLRQRTQPDTSAGLTRQQVHLQLDEAFRRLLAGASQETLPANLVTDFVAEFSDVPLVRDRASELLSQTTTPARLRSALLAGVTKNQSELDAAWVAPILQELRSGDRRRVIAALKSTIAIGSAAFKQDWMVLIGDENQPPEVRLLAIEALQQLDRRPTSGVFRLLMHFAALGRPSDQSIAIRLLGRAALTADQKDRVIELIPAAGPQQLRDLLPVFQGSLPEDCAKRFLESLAASRSLTGLSMVELSEVVKRFPAALHEPANRLLQQLKDQEADRLRKLDALLQQVGQGNAADGEKLFFSTKAKCGDCHRIGDRGRRVGPDLTTIGANRSAADLLESILFPSASIVRQYEPWSIVTSDGLTYHGLVLEETADEIQIQQATGEPRRIARSQIEDLRPATVSVMPAGLENTLTSREILDIVTWLQRLK